MTSSKLALRDHTARSATNPLGFPKENEDQYHDGGNRSALHMLRRTLRAANYRPCTTRRMLLPFDAHNHVHLSTNPQALTSLMVGGNLQGMAIMSTHPRDFPRVSNLFHEYKDIDIVPGFGIHPWFLHELDDQDKLQWPSLLEQRLEEYPNAIVGEVGLDGHRYDPEKGNLVTPMQDQILIFEQQMQLAARYQRPVSVHAVLCWGPLMESLSKLRKQDCLPPTIYFHAFGGKVGTVDQLLALCRGNQQTYFGFAPCINFRSPKTAHAIQKVGLGRLVLETDRENASFVEEEIEYGIDMIAKVLGDVSREQVIERTTANAKELYRL